MALERDRPDRAHRAVVEGRRAVKPPRTPSVATGLPKSRKVAWVVLGMVVLALVAVAVVNLRRPHAVTVYEEVSSGTFSALNYPFATREVIDPSTGKREFCVLDSSGAKILAAPIDQIAEISHSWVPGQSKEVHVTLRLKDGSVQEALVPAIAR